jgi:hypothetical protein
MSHPAQIQANSTRPRAKIITGLLGWPTILPRTAIKPISSNAAIARLRGRLEDRAEFDKAAKPYNVIAHFFEQSSAGLRKHKPEGEEKPPTVSTRHRWREDFPWLKPPRSDCERGSRPRKI